MSYTDLRDFFQEYETTDGTGLRVQLEKLGGGTVDKAYDGNWRYIVTDADGREVGRGQDYRVGMPKTHAEVAADLLIYFYDERVHDLSAVEHDEPGQMQ